MSVKNPRTKDRAQLIFRLCFVDVAASCKTNGGFERDIREKEGQVPRTNQVFPRRSLPIMKLMIALSVFLVMGSTCWIHAEKSKSTAEISDPVKRKLFIDPSPTSVRLGKATLIVSPLSRRGGNYIGDYQLKVRPYFFKSETGTLILGASDDFVRRLQSGRAIDFTGKALTREDGTTHVVLGRATPLSGDRGTVTFSIVTERNSKIIFKTSYHFET